MMSSSLRNLPLFLSVFEPGLRWEGSRGSGARLIDGGVDEDLIFTTVQLARGHSRGLHR